MKHRLHIDNQQFTEKPTGHHSAQITQRICCDVNIASINNIADVVSKGQSMIFGTSLSNQRVCSDFEQSSLVAVDIDKSSMSPQELKSILKPSLMYYSFSQASPGIINPPDHQKPGWNYRAVWQLESPITDRQRYKSLVSALILKLNSDGSCKDSLRLFHGSYKSSVIMCDETVVLTNSKVSELVAQIPVKHYVPRVQSDNVCIDDLKDYEVRLLINKLEDLKKYLLTFNDSRYEKLRKVLGVLFNIPFLSAELANDIAIDFIDGDSELSVMYAEDKYTNLLENYMNHLEAKYG